MKHQNPSSLAAYLSPLVLATVVVAGCGQAFSLTGGTSGGGGNGGGDVTASSTGGVAASTSSTGATTGSSSASSSSAASSGSGLMGTCNWNPAVANPCPIGEYCDDNSCGKTTGAGKCKSKIVNKPGDVPVCGCDGLTYWNGGMAAGRGMPTQHNVACPTDVDVGCTDLKPCPSGNNIYCRKYDKNCMIAFEGACWVLPADCTSTASQVETCLPKNCVNECDAIKQGNAFDQPCGG